MVKIAPNSIAVDARTLHRPIPFDPFMKSPLGGIDLDSWQSQREEIMDAILHPIAGGVHGDSLNCSEAI
jgi:hypothetical protein